MWTRGHVLIVGTGKRKDAPKQGVPEQKLYLLFYALCPKGHRVGILSDRVWTKDHILVIGVGKRKDAPTQGVHFMAR